MSTVEIAELTGKRHDNVLRDAETMLAALKKDRLSFEHIFFDAYGRPQPCLNLPKLECLTLVTGYSVELRYRIVGRWIRLEAEAVEIGGDLVQTIDALLGSAFPLHARRRIGIKSSQRRLFDRRNESTCVSVGHRSVAFRFALSSEPKFIASVLRAAGLLPKLMSPLADKLLNAAHFRLLGKPQTECAA
jgi:hypothetical protein